MVNRERDACAAHFEGPMPHRQSAMRAPRTKVPPLSMRAGNAGEGNAGGAPFYLPLCAGDAELALLRTPTSCLELTMRGSLVLVIWSTSESDN